MAAHPLPNGALDEHRLSLPELAARYSTSIDTDAPERSRGLTPAAAAALHATLGPNALSPPKTTPELVKWALQFTNLMLLLLLAAAAFAFLAYGLNSGSQGNSANLILAVVLLILVLVTGTIAYLQERSAARTIDSIRAMLPLEVKVIRGGVEAVLPVGTLVPGDIIKLTIGNKVPADARVIAGLIKVETSSLTGESEPFSCTPIRRSDVPEESRNLVFSSSLVMAGECTAVVVRTGDSTLIGKIAFLATKAEEAKSTFEVEVHRFVIFVGILALSMAIVFFVIGMSRGLGFVFSLVNAFILVLIANCPEGLPVTLTTILALAAQRLAHDNVFIKRTSLLETLGSCSIICTDKTGTLTQNRMTVHSAWLASGFVAVRRVRRGRDAADAMAIGRTMSILEATEEQRGSTAIVHSTSLEPEALLLAASEGREGGHGLHFGGTAEAIAPGPVHAALVPALARQLSSAAILRAQRPAILRTHTWATGAALAPLGSAEQPCAVGMSFATLRGLGLSVEPQRFVPVHTVGPRESAHVIHRSQSLVAYGGGSGGGNTAEAPLPLSLPPPPPPVATAPLPRPPSQQPAFTAPSIAHDAVLQLFHGMTRASWRDSNAFTRLLTIAIVANKARFTEQLETPPAWEVAATAAREAASKTAAANALAAAVTRRPGAHGHRHSMHHPSGSSTATGNLSLLQRLWGSVCCRSISQQPPPAVAIAPALPGVGAVGGMEGGSGVGEGGEERGSWEEEEDVEPFEAEDVAALTAPHSDVLMGHPLSVRRMSSFITHRPPPAVRLGTAAHRRNMAIIGDASDAALLRYCDSLMPVAAWRAAFPVLYERPFDSITKTSFAIVQLPEPVTATSTTRRRGGSGGGFGTTPSGSTSSTAVHAVLLKGAPERVLDICSHYLADEADASSGGGSVGDSSSSGGSSGSGSGSAGSDGYLGGCREVPIDDAFKAEWLAAYERFGTQGERVLGFAYRTFAPHAHTGPGSVYDAAAELVDAASPPYPTCGLVFAGLVSLADPPKPGVDNAVRQCRRASIKVAMVTGDHPLTAEAIARKCSLITLPTAREVAAAAGVSEASIPLSDERVGAVIISGLTLASYTEPQWDTLLAKPEVVFARTSPEQKLTIVQHYQRRGAIVCVTGDGTNDAPALKRADVGVSMGSASASDVAREAADMVIMDDSFDHIVAAIKEGRLVFANVRKTIAYTVTHAVPELLPVFLLLAFDVPLALPGVLLLTIDILTEQGPAISLTYEREEADLMSVPPRDIKTQRLVDGPLLRYSYVWMSLLECLVCLGAFLLSLSQMGYPVGDVIFNNDLWSNADDDPRALHAYRSAVSAYYFQLIMCQFWHIHMCRTRTASLFTQGLFTNKMTLWGCAFAVAIAFIVIYVLPGSLFNTTPLTLASSFVLNLAFLAVALPLTEGGKWEARRNPRGWWAHHMQW